MNSEPKLKRLVGLDILRTVAVLLVLGRHFPQTYPATNHWLGWILQGWKECGWAGVDLFFVLSGFLVGGLLIQERMKYGEIQLKRFLIRRGFKIYPAFYVMILASIVLRWKFHFPKVISELLFVQNYFPGLWYHTWSLAVEEHFYLILATALTLVAVRKFVPWAFVMCLVIPLMRIVHARWQPLYGDMTHLFPTHLRLDSLLWGVLLAVWYGYHREHFSRFWSRFCFAGTIFAVSAFLSLTVFPLGQESALPNHFLDTLGFTVLAWASAALVGVSVSREWGNSRLLRLVQAVGQNSYSIYLWHMLVHQILFDWRSPVKYAKKFGVAAEFWQSTHAREWNCLIFIVISISWGIIMAKLIEFPVLKVRDRLFPSR